MSKSSKIVEIFEGYELSTSDKLIFERLQVPLPEDEAKRIEIVRQTTLLDSSQSDDGFDRISSLASRIFSVNMHFTYVVKFCFYFFFLFRCPTLPLLWLILTEFGINHCVEST